MPPKAKQVGHLSNEEKEVILFGFRELGWDPEETNGPRINTILKSLDQEPHKDKFKVLKPHFSANNGGTKANNNTLYQHYKDIGCEFMVEITRAGFHRLDKNVGGVCCFAGTSMTDGHFAHRIACYFFFCS